MRPANPLHIMAKLAGVPQIAMANLRWRAVRTENLHWTVIPSQDAALWQPALIASVIENLDARPFGLIFDRVDGRTGGIAQAHCRAVPREARQLVTALRKGFKAEGIVFSRGVRPHVTLDYKWSGPDFAEAIAPIEWTVDRLMLIESVTGEARHILHGTWPLVPRQGLLFPLLPCDAGRGGTLAALPG